jgi:hypothetical protein
MTEHEVLKDYPGWKPGDIQACIAYQTPTPVCRAKTAKDRQDLPLDTLLPVRQHKAKTSATRSQFFLTRAAPLKGRRVEKQILITQSP